MAAAYISEISKAEGRGFFVLIYEAAFGLGLFLVSALGRLIVPSVGWQGMFIIGAIPAIVVVVMRFFVPESPRWLAEHSRYAEADRIVAGMEKDASKGGTVQLAPVVVKPHIVAKAAGFGSLFEGIYAKRTLTLWVIWSCTYFACYGMLTWLPTLYTTVYKLPLETALTYPVITGGFNFLATILPPFYVDRIGRKPILQFGMLIGAVEMLALWLSGAHDASLLLIFSTLGMFTFGQVALTVFVFSPENYPTRMRALGSSTASAWMRLASIISPTIMGAVVPVAGVAGAFLIIGLVLLAGGIVTSFAAIETKGKVLEELSP